MLTTLSCCTQAASATNLQFVGEGDKPTETQEWTDLNWAVEGKVGSLSTWELALQNNKYQVQSGTERQWNWVNNEQVPWQLDWDSSNRQIKFTLGSDLRKQVSFFNANSVMNEFNGFYLWTRATTTLNMVDPGTKISLEVTEVKGINDSIFTSVSGISSSATAPSTSNQTAITKNFFSSNESIASLKGFVSMSWTSNNPQAKGANSRVGFKIKGYNRPVAVSEPASILGLLAVGTIGASSTLKCKKANTEENR
ncbi:choice-of-anchor W domain-containing protein [Hydrococcus rivularis]|uniref:choice-of-anchor W domain-containing protein n=1 Tax=Hydrococcus rivularis TaxID=1616834 RepID=UPI003183EB11